MGIGGVSMSPLAEGLHGEGLVITGSDMKESPTVARLRALGIPVTIGHLPETSLPVGGKSTHCVLSGHRGLPGAKLFSDLDKHGKK